MRPPGAYYFAGTTSRRCAVALPGEGDVAPGRVDLDVSAVADLAAGGLVEEPEDVEAFAGSRDLDVGVGVGIEDELGPVVDDAVVECVVEVDAADAGSEDESDAFADSGCCCVREGRPGRGIGGRCALPVDRAGHLAVRVADETGALGHLRGQNQASFGLSRCVDTALRRAVARAGTQREG
jgi:hypothetical protein